MPQLLGKEIGSTGYGMMGLTWTFTKGSIPPTEQAFEAMREALKNGSNFWNGGQIYGEPDYNSLVLLEKYFAKYPEDADKVVISIKGGMNPKTMKPDGSPEGTRNAIDSCIAQLGGRKKLDIFEFARRDQEADMALTFDIIEKEYVQTGKLGGVSLSEVRLETIQEAIKHVKVVAVEVELSLFSTDVLENGIAAFCAQHSIPLVAYSPMGRGMLTGQIKKLDDIPANSTLRHMPRFQPDTFDLNLELVHKVEALASKKGCTPAQLAIGWVKAISRKPGMPTIIPIPGASSAARVAENTVHVDISDEEMAEIDEILAKFTTAGDRYPAMIPHNT